MNLLQLIGGLAGVFRMVIEPLVDNPDLDAAADRKLTIPEKDHRRLCGSFGIKDETVIKQGLELARKAGDANGDYAAFMVRHAVKH